MHVRAKLRIHTSRPVLLNFQLGGPVVSIESSAGAVKKKVTARPVVQFKI